MKESKTCGDRQLLFRDGLLSEQETRSLGAIPTAITYSNGVATFNGSTSKIVYPTVSGVLSVRLIFTPGTTTQNILKLSSTHSISVSAGTVAGTGFASPTIYVNGVAGSTITATKVEVVITTATAIRAKDIQLGFISTYLTGTVELMECYNTVLSANDVKNLFEGKRYKALNFNSAGRKLILDVSASSGAIANRLSGNAYNELITNGGFNSATGWSVGTGWSIANGVASLDGSQVSTSYLNPTSNILTIGKTYQAIVSVSNVTGTINLALGSTSVYLRLVNGINTITTACSGSTALLFQAIVGASVNSIDNVSVKEVIPAVVSTSMAVSKQGEVNAMQFNGTTSKVDCGSYDTLVGDKTFVVWMKETTINNNAGIISNNNTSTGFYIISRSDSNLYRVTSGPSVAYFPGSWSGGTVRRKQFYLLVLTRTSTGVCNMYINGIAGTEVNSATGTPTAGTNLFIGSWSGSNFNGLIPHVRIIDGILTTQEIAQIWSSERGKYNI